MRAWIDVGFHSFGIGRVAFQLEKYLPAGVEIAGDIGSADFVIMHIMGRRDHKLKDARSLLAQGKKYAVIQYVMESSRNPNPEDWKEIWDGATAVWSYYDLKKYVPDLYHRPLGVDPTIWYKEADAKRDFLAVTVGEAYKDECLGEVRAAAYKLQKKIIYLGPNTAADPNVITKRNLTDDDVRKVYNSCKYASALRRKDGFEMVALEALLCGTRPIVFDTPNYRQWYDGLAEFVPEISPEDTVQNLIRVLSKEPKPVADWEIDHIKKNFDWKTLIDGFWERCLS